MVDLSIVFVCLPEGRYVSSKIPQASTAFSTPRQRQCQAQERLRRTAQSLFRRAARAARADVHGGVAWLEVEPSNF